MDWHEAIAPKLPPPLEGEPVQLRRDIEDELADHLACAFQRELGRSGDPAQAERAALERFGNPKKLARQLWLQAMKETLMNQRIQLAAVVLLAVGVFAVIAFSWVALDRAQQTNQAMLVTLGKLAGNQPGRGAAEANWSRLRVRILTEKTRQPLPGMQISITGQPFSDAKDARDSLEEISDARGVCSFGPVRPGAYALGAAKRDSGGGSEPNQSDFFLSKRIVLYPSGETREIILNYPDPIPVAPVRLRVALPADLQKVDYLFVSHIIPVPKEINQFSWDSPEHDIFWTSAGESFRKGQVDSLNIELGASSISRILVAGAQFQGEDKALTLIPETGAFIGSINLYIRYPQSSVLNAQSTLPYYARAITLDLSDRGAHTFKPRAGTENEWVIQLNPKQIEQVRAAVKAVQKETTPAAPSGLSQGEGGKS